MGNKSLSFVNVRLVKDKTLGEGSRILNKDDAIKFVSNNMKELDREHFVALNLNTKGVVVNATVVAIGDLSATIIHPREVFKTNLLSNAASTIFLHNHPSGNPEPSKEDIDVTRRLMKAGNLLGIRVLDHIVVGEDTNVSLRNERADLFYESEISINEIEIWNKEFSLSKDKIIEKYTDIKIERFIDGIPYEFKLKADEIRAIYEKLGKDKDLEWEPSLINQKYETKVAEEPECEIEDFEMGM